MLIRKNALGTTVSLCSIMTAESTAFTPVLPSHSMTRWNQVNTHGYALNPKLNKLSSHRASMRQSGWPLALRGEPDNHKSEATTNHREVTSNFPERDRLLQLPLSQVSEAQRRQNAKLLSALFPIDKMIGMEAINQVRNGVPCPRNNAFLRLKLPGLSVSSRWVEGVKNLQSPGPFPTARKLINVETTFGKNVDIVVDYPTQASVGQSKDFPLVVYCSPGFIGKVALPMGYVVYDAQLGFPFMEHFATYGMVSATVLETESVLRDGVNNIDHSRQAKELNDIIDTLVEYNGAMVGNDLPNVDSNRVGILGYSRGGKVGLHAAAERIETNKNRAKQKGIPISEARVVSIAKDPVNIGGVPPFVLDRLSDYVEQVWPEEFKQWKNSSFRSPVAPLPNSHPNSVYPIEKITDPVLIFSARNNWINPEPQYGARVFYENLPVNSVNREQNIMIETKGPHESWVNSPGIKNESKAAMVAFFLTHLADREEFGIHLTPTVLLNGSHSAFSKVVVGPIESKKF